MKHYALIILILALLASAGGFFLFRDADAPTLELTPAAGPVSASRPLSLALKDEGAGLKSVQVSVTQNGQTTELLNTAYDRGTASETVNLSLAEAKLVNGPLSLQIKATDHAFFANTAEQNVTFDFDSRAPVVSVLSTAHNIYEGGTALVLYKISEEVERNGVQVGNWFFPGYLQEGGYYACLFAYPFDLGKETFLPRIIAVDRAGNERKAGFYYHTNARPARKDRINITDGFLDSKMPEFQDLFPDAENMLDIFLRVNRELRTQNRAKLKEIGARTASSPTWQGTFLRLPNAANRAQFNEVRTYVYNGNEIDQQTHLGHDLASLAQSPVPAGNAGEVVFADYLGIYGQVVIIDHGLGLQSLYAHLSSIDVDAGTMVEKGQIIGRTGTSGLAGGDHLHFGIILSGLPVDPIEWWDPNWIKNNFTDKWQDALSLPAGN
ncbi:MAG: M23 family metallopeptidase [Syntrophotaleaceae bacterium]